MTCKGLTIKGVQCKNPVYGNYCHLHIDQEEHCSICVEPLKNQVNLDCAHKFCRKCINTWICTSCPNYSCPLCRGNLDITNVNIGIKWGIKNNYLVTLSLHQLPFSSLKIENQQLLTKFLNFYKDQYYFENQIEHIKNIINDENANAIVKQIFQVLLNNRKTVNIIAKINPDNYTKNVYMLV